MDGSWTLSPIGDGIGVRVEGDLTQGVSAPQTAEIARLVAEHGVVVFRGQHGLTEAVQNEALSGIGRIQKHAGPMDRDVIANTTSEGTVETDPESAELAAFPWHNDGEFLPKPLCALALYGVELQEGASWTEFASGLRAYRRLPGALKQKIETLDALHVLAANFNKRNRVRDVPAHFPRHSSPVADTHPITGQRFLSLAEFFLDSIDGLSEPESERLIEALFSYLHNDENVYRHYWKVGDLVVWDNLTVQHRRPNLSQAGPRVLRRNSIGPFSQSEQMRQVDTGDYEKARADGGFA